MTKSNMTIKLLLTLTVAPKETNVTKLAYGNHGFYLLKLVCRCLFEKVEQH